MKMSPQSSGSDKSQARIQRDAEQNSASCLLHIGFMLGVLFDPEYGGDIFL
jgi:hypothetical protein